MRSRNGFSLIELLVILAILAMLVGMFIPAIFRVRQAAVETQCVNNEKQLALAYNNWRTANTTAFKVPTWVETLSPYLEDNKPTFMCPVVTEAKPAEVQITGMIATAKSSWDVTLTPASRAIDGSGLSELPDPAHDSDFRHMWLSDGSGADGQWLSLALGGSYKVSHLMICNYNQKDKTWRGVRSCDIQVSTDNEKWKTVAENVPLEQAPGNVDVKFQTVPLPGSPSAQHVRIKINSNFGGKDKHVGLSEVQVSGRLDYQGTHYGMNAYIGTTRRVSNTSGTICFLEYNQPVADMTSPEKYPGYMRPTGVSGRHPAPTMLNVAFVDGHVDRFTTTALNPAGTVDGKMDIGDIYWNNFGKQRSD